MLKATLRSLLARKLRLLLSGFAVVLGVAFVSGSYVLTDSLGRVFDNLFANLGQNTAVQVQGIDRTGDEGNREPVPQAVLDKIRSIDGVKEAVGNWFTEGVDVVGKDGKVVKKNGPPASGASIDVASPQEDLQITRGVAPVGLEQVALDPQTVRQEGFALGDRVTLVVKGPRRAFTLVGIVRLGSTDNLAGASIAAFDPTTAQRLFGVPAAWLNVAVAADSGVDEATLQRRIAAVLPDGFEAVSQKAAADQQAKDVRQGLSFFNTFLLAFGGIALFVGMFLIFNTFSMLVAQRTRELALMRALGASRRQVTGAVLVEALLVGVIASLLGFGLGIGVALGLKALLGALGASLPAGPTVVALRTFVVSMVVGVGVTAVAALAPARKAARVAPVQAMRDSGPAEDRALGRRTAFGSVVLAAGIAAVAGGLNQGTLSLVGLGAALTFLGVAILSPLFARPVVAFLGLALSRGVPGRLGRGNAMRSPRRTSATAAALMIGLALVAMVSTAGASLKKSVVAVVSESLRTDYVLHTTQFEPFDPAVAVALAKEPVLKAVVPFRVGSVRVEGDSTQIQGVDPTDLPKVLTLTTDSGSLASLGDGRLAISEPYATSHQKKVGDTITITWAKTGPTPIKVGVVFARNQFAGDLLVSNPTFDANTTKPALVVVAVNGNGDDTASRAAIERGLSGFASLEVQDQRQFVKTQGDQIDTLLTILTVLLSFSVLIAVLGVVNTLALSVIERTRELGLLRAVGLQRRQLRRMIRVESVLIAVYGALLGVGIGVAFGWALVQALKDEGVTQFAIPYGRLFLVLAFAALAGVFAAALPARRAARMDVLAAISHT